MLLNSYLYSFTQKSDFLTKRRFRRSSHCSSQVWVSHRIDCRPTNRFGGGAFLVEGPQIALWFLSTYSYWDIIRSCRISVRGRGQTSFISVPTDRDHSYGDEVLYGTPLQFAGLFRPIYRFSKNISGNSQIIFENSQNFSSYNPKNSKYLPKFAYNKFDSTAPNGPFFGKNRDIFGGGLTPRGPTIQNRFFDP